MDFKSKCIICGSPDNLTARLTVLVGTKNYDVSLCEDHEDVTPKQVRVEVSKKIQEFTELTKKLKEFGYEVKDSPIAIPTPQEIRRLAPKPKEEPEPIVEDDPNCPVEEEPQERPAEQAPEAPEKPKRVLREQKVDKRGYQISKPSAQPAQPAIPHVRGIGGSVSGHGIAGDVENRSSINPHEELRTLSEKLNVKLPATKEVQKQTVPGRGGVNMTIPSVIKDSSGVTTVKIVNTGGNEALQKRFKALKDIGDSSNTANPVSGYTSIDCPLCRGSGRVRNKGADQKCPKCGGRGVIDKIMSS